MQKICTSCNHIGKEIRTVYLYAIAPIFLIVIALIMAVYLHSLHPMPIWTPIIWFVFGIYILTIFLDSSDTCPKCNKRKTMIPLDTPRAQAIIKEHDLTVPTSTIPETNLDPK